jgi:hypothetical protein
VAVVVVTGVVVVVVVGVVVVVVVWPSSLSLSELELRSPS